MYISFSVIKYPAVQFKVKKYLDYKRVNIYACYSLEEICALFNLTYRAVSISIHSSDCLSADFRSFLFVFFNIFMWFILHFLHAWIRDCIDDKFYFISFFFRFYINLYFEFNFYLMFLLFSFKTETDTTIVWLLLLLFCYVFCTRIVAV